MATLPKATPGKPKKVEVKTQSQTYTAVRLSMVVMTALAMVSTSVILAALLIRLIPVRDTGRVPAPVARASANGNVGGELLVKFAVKSTQLSRTQAVQAALQKPVNVSTVTTVKQRQGLKTVTRSVETISQKIATLQSITPVVSSSVKLTSVANVTRNKRGVATDVAGSVSALGQWFVVRVNPATADLSQIATNLRKQVGVEKVESNRRVSAAAVRSLSSTTAGALLNLADAQKAAGVLVGDATNDGVVDGKDYRMLMNYLYHDGSKPTNMAAADVDHDGNVDIADITQLGAMLTPVYKITPKDMTGDGVFNVDDLNFVSAFLWKGGPAPSPLSLADWDGDGNVDIADFRDMIDYLYGDWKNGNLQYGSGDVNADGVVDELDVHALSAFLAYDGPAPKPLTIADLDLDGIVDWSDMTLLIARVYNITGQSSSQTVSAATVSPTSSTTTTSDTLTSGATVVIPPAYLAGDANADSAVNALDLDYLIKYLYFKGPTPNPLARADVDGDGLVDISDVTWMVNFVTAHLQAKIAAADLNADGVVNQADVDALVGYLYPSGVAAPVTIDLTKADVTFDGTVDMADLTLLIDYLMRHTAQPTTCPVIRTVSTISFLNGDINGDGSVTSADGLALAKQVYAQGPVPVPAERADLNCDTKVNGFDVATFSTITKSQPSVSSPVIQIAGDANADGIVNSSDLALNLKAALGTGTSTNNDVNHDGRVNYKDTYDFVALLHLDTATKPLVDLTGDGKITRADSSKLMTDVVNGNAVADAAADVNGDGTVDVADAIAFIKTLDAQSPATAVLAGDVTADGIVDCRDAKSLYTTYFKKGPAVTPALRGDVNGDGKANQVDLFLLAERTCGNGPVSTLANVRIALLDTGLQVSPAVMKEVLASTKELTNGRDNDRNGYVADVEGWNSLNNTPAVTDCQGHGTALATMLAARTGVSPLAKIIPVRVLDCKGNGTALSLANGLVYATVRGADIAELPLSGVGSSLLMVDVVRYAKASGMLVVGAAGNDATPASRVLPANVSGVLSVGATTSNGKSLASYTNTGAAVNAPGAALGVAFEGTSVSATYVAGTAALALMKSPGLTLKALEAKLIPVPSVVNPKNPKDTKVLDALKAVQ